MWSGGPDFMSRESPLLDAADPGVAQALAPCRVACQARGFAPIGVILQAAGVLVPAGGRGAAVRALMALFNTPAPARARIAVAARAGDADAVALQAVLPDPAPGGLPWHPIPRDTALALEARLIAEPELCPAGLGPDLPYPGVTDDGGLAFDGGFAARALAQGRARFARFAQGRRHDTAVLVGNGPSLARLDPALLAGQDVYISNYAILNERFHRLARGVAVTNRLVAAQDPAAFRSTALWRFHPLWLADVLGGAQADAEHDEGLIFLNALGGRLFFSSDVCARVAWHSTVTFFWLQILFAAGYRKVCLIGVDNRYDQHPGAREGDVIRQAGPDTNHFDPGYFTGKNWQAADTDRMARAYALAGEHYACDGREIVDCTEGGALDLFRRSTLQAELPPRAHTPRALPAPRDRLAGGLAKPAARQAVLRQAVRLLLDGSDMHRPAKEACPDAAFDKDRHDLGPQDPACMLLARVMAFRGAAADG